MDRFLEILREEFNRQLSMGGNFTTKERILKIFDKTCIEALAKYNIEVVIKHGRT